MAAGVSICSSSQREEGELVPTHPLPSLSRSFSAAVSGQINRTLEGEQLRLQPAQIQPTITTKYNAPDLALLKPISQHEGKKAVLFPYSEKTNLVQKLTFVLVGKFSHGRPAWSKIKTFIQDLKLNSYCNVANIDHKHIVIECNCKDDYYRIWLNLVWYIDGYAMRVFKWGPAFSPLIESPIAPVWVRFEGLPLHMFEELSLWSISNAIGHPIQIDPRNLNRSMLNSARVCVELDVSQPLIDSLCICFNDEVTGMVVESFCVQIYYDVVPFYCAGCCHIGHQLDKCKRKQATSGSEAAKSHQIPTGNGAKLVHLTCPVDASAVLTREANAKFKQRTQIWQPVGKVRKTDMAAASQSNATGITVSNCFDALSEDQVKRMSVIPTELDAAHPKPSSTAAANQIGELGGTIVLRKQFVSSTDLAEVAASSSGVGAGKAQLGSSNASECNNISDHTAPSDEQNSQPIHSVFSQGTHAEQVKGHPGSSIVLIAANADCNQKGNNAATTAQYKRLQSSKVDMAMHNTPDQIVTTLQQNPSAHSSIATSDQHALDRIQQITEQLYLKQVVQAIEQAIVQERIQGHELNELRIAADQNVKVNTAMQAQSSTSLANHKLQQLEVQNRFDGLLLEDSDAPSSRLEGLAGEHVDTAAADQDNKAIVLAVLPVDEGQAFQAEETGTHQGQKEVPAVPSVVQEKEVPIHHTSSSTWADQAETEDDIADEQEREPQYNGLALKLQGGDTDIHTAEKVRYIDLEKIDVFDDIIAPRKPGSVPSSPRFSRRAPALDDLAFSSIHKVDEYPDDWWEDNMEMEPTSSFRNRYNFRVRKSSRKGFKYKG